jgi:hypothetical protein
MLERRFGNIEDAAILTGKTAAVARPMARP